MFSKHRHVTISYVERGRDKHAGLQSVTNVCCALLETNMKITRKSDIPSTIRINNQWT